MNSTGTYEKQIAEILCALGIPEKYRDRRPVPEAADLVPVGADIYGRDQKLAPDAAAAWQKMRAAAGLDGVVLLLVSAFRSVVYQRQIIERKLAAGQTMDQILRASAAPGFSEHHSGRVIDVTSPNCKPLTEEFERTAEFAWLVRHAKDFGFAMTYPHDNPFGVIYEPWHWAFQDSSVERVSSSVQVREATVADAHRIAEIHVAGWRAAYRGQMPDEVLDNLDVEKRAAFWSAQLTAKPHALFVAESNLEILAFCDLIPSRDADSDPATTAEIVAIYADPNHWRKGAGKALCRFALERARLGNYTAVTLWCLSSNIPARMFYEKIGFYLDGATKIDNSFRNHELHKVRFRISL